LHNSPRLEDLYNRYSLKVEIQDKIRATKKKITIAHSIMQLDELKYRKRVLRRLGFIAGDDVIQMKARVACEISTGDELLLAELLFNRTFNELTPEQIAALLSCFVFEENSKTDAKLQDDLAKPFQELQSQARLIAKISAESKLPVSEDEYVQKFKPQLMEVVYTWSKGASFASICKMTDVYEGSLIRMFRRLEELLRQMSLAAKVMGSTELEEKFDQSLEKVKRGMHSLSLNSVE
jgi:ATP-dependent RNA helicase DOB1